MTSYLIDINVWLALTWGQHPLHAPAVRWFSGNRKATFLFCRLTMIGLLRLLSNRTVMGDSTISTTEALKLYDQWLEDLRVEFMPEPGEADRLFREVLLMLGGRLHATNAVADCYLIGFAEAAGAHLVTFDKALAKRASDRDAKVTLIETAGLN